MVNDKKMTEQELLLAAQQDDEAFALLYQRYYRLVYYVAYKMCRNDADAQDVVQETFMEVRRSLCDLKNPQYFRLWLYRVVDSKCKKLFRKNKYALTDIEQDHILNEFLEQNEQFLPEASLKYTNDRDIMHRFIKELPYDQKYAIILYYMQQMTTLEIAELLKVPEGTIKSRLSVGRATLRKKVEAYEHREGIKLNFREGVSGSVMAAILSDQLQSVAVKPKRSRLQRFLNSFSSMNLTMRLSLIACGAGIIIPAGMILFEINQSFGTQTVQNETSVFPQLYYRGISVNSGKEAYYTLKMNICVQDIEALSEQQRTEALPLYEALKAENGIYYARLKESNWAQAFENEIK